MSIVGSLMYAMTCTRPDLAFTMSRLSKFCSNPSAIHIRAARHALRYLQSTKNTGITYRKSTTHSQLEVSGFSDSDFAADLDNRRSTSGYVFTAGGSAISWRSKQQDLVTLSTMEAEYVGLTEAAKEMLWLQRLQSDIKERSGSTIYMSKSQILHGDNQGSIQLASNPKYHARSKHINVKYHFLRDLVTTGAVVLNWIPTQTMTADVLTKPLSAVLHTRHTKAMGLL